MTQKGGAPSSDQTDKRQPPCDADAVYIKPNMVRNGGAGRRLAALRAALRLVLYPHVADVGGT